MLLRSKVFSTRKGESGEKISVLLFLLAVERSVRMSQQSITM
jgi:hypothetical protein